VRSWPTASTTIDPRWTTWRGLGGAVRHDNHEHRLPYLLREADYREGIKRVIGTLKPCGAKRTLESLQPYKGRKRLVERQHHPLWLLHRLDIAAKHQSVGTIAAALPYLRFGVENPANALDTVDWDWEFSPDETVIHGDAMTVVVTVFSHPLDEVDVSLQAAIDIALAYHGDRRLPNRPLPLMLSLRRIRTSVL
jgi:hypothetical protein